MSWHTWSTRSSLSIDRRRYELIRSTPPPAPATLSDARDEEGEVGMDGQRDKRTALIVEDNPSCRYFLELCLHYEGFEVTAVPDGEQALAAAGSAAFDLILLDLRLPGISGLDVARRLRAAGNAVPILAVTAAAFPTDREACLAAGMNGYLSKPFLHTQLFAFIEDITSRPPRL